jgi:lauroyl/myristoyl acyltransferase
LVRQWLATPLKDFVASRRVICGHDNPCDWRIRERNPERIEQLRNSGESYILASAHFSRNAIGALFAPEVTPGNPIQVVNSFFRSRSVKEFRISIQYRNMLKALRKSWEERVGMSFVTGESKTVFDLRKKLKEPGNVVMIQIDANWTATKTGRGVLKRPFAGYLHREFSTGAAKLARISKCPIIGCVYTIQDDGTIFVEWGVPKRDMANPNRVMDELLDMMEQAIGERPSQYVLRIGGERRWNVETRTWEPLSDFANEHR